MIDDERYMAMAVEAAELVRHRTSPNPWVGCTIVATDGTVATGATFPPGGPHAERAALSAVDDPRGATVYTTLEPCGHTGRTGPCTDALIDAGVKRVVAAIEDPDPSVAGAGFTRLRDAGLEVESGLLAERVEDQLAPYLHHRRTGRPWVVLKLGASLDGRTAAPDGTSRWITGAPARADGHRLRAESDAIVVGAGTVRADDPALTVRDWPPAGSSIPAEEVHHPRRVVLGDAPPEAAVHPCLEWKGPIDELLDHLGAEGVVQLMVEGGASVAATFHETGLVDHYTIYLAPALFGGDDGRALFAGPGATTLDQVWRGRIVATEMVGTDVRIDVRARPRGG